MRSLFSVGDWELVTFTLRSVANADADQLDNVLREAITDAGQN